MITPNTKLRDYVLENTTPNQHDMITSNAAADPDFDWFALAKAIMVTREDLPVIN